MVHQMLGQETEYALTLWNRDSGSSVRGPAIENLFMMAKKKLVHLPDLGTRGHGLFLANGSRFYLDCGAHVEYSTPECLNPRDVIRYSRANDRILADLIKDYVRQVPGLPSVIISKCNVDYAEGSISTWGCHESYLHRYTGKLELLYEELMPHLVSRIIFTGAGGFNSLSSGLEYLVSPRVPHLVTCVSNSSTKTRGIIHTKNEPLGKGYNRLHLLCGESLCSEKAEWLKLGTTALVVAMAERGLNPGREVRLANPLAALNIFARDPRCNVMTAATTGKHVTALEIQRHYLGMAEANLHADYMPSWAKDVCAAWREILDKLEKAPESVERELDWSIKLSLFKGHVRRRGFSWEKLAQWGVVLSRIRVALNRCKFRGEITEDLVTRADSPIVGEIRNLDHYLKLNGLQWCDFIPFIRLRAELYEIDWRCGALDENALFVSLDQQGVLDHRLLSEGEIEDATQNPPKEGRASVRGNIIRQLAGQIPPPICDWSLVQDHKTKRVAEMFDPFSSKETWVPMNNNQIQRELEMNMRMRRRRRIESNSRARDRTKILRILRNELGEEEAIRLIRNLGL